MTTFLKVKNRAVSTLDGGINDVVLEFTVAAGEGALFPSVFPFHVTIEDEILEVTNRVGDVFTCTREAEGTTGAAHADGKTVSLNITAQAVSDLNTAVKAIEDAKGAANGYASLSAATKVTEQPVSITDHLEATPSDGETTKAPNSDWAYDHNAALLGADVHNNTTFAWVWHSPDQENIEGGGLYCRVELNQVSYDLGSNFIGAASEKHYDQVQADADSDATHIEDDDGVFTEAKCKYALVSWSSDDPPTANIGTGYVTAVDADTLTINKNSGDDFGASYYYTITKSHYLVPVTGVYFVACGLAWVTAAIEADKSYIFGYTVNGSSRVIWGIHSSVAATILRQAKSRLDYLTAGDFVSLYGRHYAAGNQSFDAGNGYTYLQLFLLRKT